MIASRTTPTLWVDGREESDEDDDDDDDDDEDDEDDEEGEGRGTKRRRAESVEKDRFGLPVGEESQVAWLNGATRVEVSKKREGQYS